METTHLAHSQESEARHQKAWRPVLSMAAAGLLVAACNGASTSGSPETSRTPMTSSTGDNSGGLESPLPTSREPGPAEDCITPRLPVFPGKRFKDSNQADIQGQLDVLRLAHSQSDPVTLADTVRANAIIANSLVDPVYARALSFADTRQSKGFSAAQLLAMQHQNDVFAAADINCLSRAQLKDVDRLYKTLVSGLAPKVGRQVSVAARQVWRELKETYQQFKSKYHDQLAAS